MREGGTLELEQTEVPVADLRLLVASDPWFRVFLQNLGDLFRRHEACSICNCNPLRRTSGLMYLSTAGFRGRALCSPARITLLR